MGTIFNVGLPNQPGGNAAQSSMTGGLYLTNPKHLNLISVPKALISVKTAQTSQVLTSAGTAFTALALRGAQTSIVSADTYVTVLDITSGSGFLFNFVTPTHDGAGIATTKITVDGTVYVIAPSANHIAGNRIVGGPITQGVPSVATAGAVATDIFFANAATDAGFQTASVGGITVQASSSIAIPTPELILSQNWQCLRYETSLKVEMKCSGLSATAVDKQCAVTFRADLV